MRQQRLRRMVGGRRSRDCREVRGIKAHRGGGGGGGGRCLLVGQVMGRVRPSHVSQDIGQTTAHCTSAASCMVLKSQSIQGQLSKRIHGGEVKARVRQRVMRAPKEHVKLHVGCGPCSSEVLRMVVELLRRIICVYKYNTTTTTSSTRRQVIRPTTTLKSSMSSNWPLLYGHLTTDQTQHVG